MKIGDKIAALERQRQAQVRAALERAARDGASVLRSAAPKSSGELKKSIRAQGLTITIDAPHVLYVEHGARPHMPPIAPLIKWVQRNRGKLGMKKGGRPGRDAQGRFTASPEVVAAAWAIAKKIEREGIKPTFFIRRSLPVMSSRAIKIVRGALRVRRSI